MKKERIKQLIMSPCDNGFQGMKILVDVYYQIIGDHVEVSKAMITDKTLAKYDACLNLPQLECRLNNDYRLHGAL